MPCEEILAQTPDLTHTLVQTHPTSGVKPLYLDPSSIVGVEGMDDAEGRALLDELTEHATRPEFVYCHYWRPGDQICGTMVYCCIAGMPSAPISTACSSVRRSGFRRIETSSPGLRAHKKRIHA